MTRRRKLRPEEEDLWRIVARSARPLHPHPLPGKMPDAELDAGFVPKDRPLPSDLPRLGAFRLGEKARSGTDPLVAPPGMAAKPPLRMDAKAFGKMTRGKLLPEARLDLHGMTLSEAHPELIRFILGAHAAGLRLVLVITGKGKPKPDHGPIPQPVGVLRHQVPQWLRLPPLGPAVVLQVAEAHQRHGGAGACYVYLRRAR